MHGTDRGYGKAGARHSFTEGKRGRSFTEGKRGRSFRDGAPKDEDRIKRVREAGRKRTQPSKRRAALVRSFIERNN